LEEFCQLRLATQVSRLRGQEDELQKLIHQRLALAEELEKRSSRGMAFPEYALYQQFAEASRQELIAKEAKRRETKKELEAERENLIQLSKEKKTLERLKEKKLKNYLYQQERDAQKQNDAMVVARYRPPRNF
jgi:flagellar protein FliJ